MPSWSNWVLPMSGYTDKHRLMRCTAGKFLGVGIALQLLHWGWRTQNNNDLHNSLSLFSIGLQLEQTFWLHTWRQPEYCSILTSFVANYVKQLVLLEGFNNISVQLVVYNNSQPLVWLTHICIDTEASMTNDSDLNLGNSLRGYSWWCCWFSGPVRLRELREEPFDNMDASATHQYPDSLNTDFENGGHTHRRLCSHLLAFIALWLWWFSRSNDLQCHIQPTSIWWSCLIIATSAATSPSSKPHIVIHMSHFQVSMSDCSLSLLSLPCSQGERTLLVTWRAFSAWPSDLYHSLEVWKFLYSRSDQKRKQTSLDKV